MNGTTIRVGLLGLLVAAWLTGPVAGCLGSGSGGSGGGAGGTGGGGAGGMGAAGRGDLIDGDPGCPGRIPVPTSSCGVGSIRCTYQGGDFGISSTDDPLTCHCQEMAWTCVLTADETKGCPVQYPPDGACATALSCSYPTAASIVQCNCTPGSGGGGAGGGQWLCGL